MRQPSSPQYRFLLRASLAFAALLVVWWFVLLGPLLAWTRFSTDFLLNALPGAPLKTGATVSAEGVWVMQAPVKVGGVWRNVRVEAGRRLPTQLTIGIPLFWAILLAAPRTKRFWRAWVLGSAILLAIPPAGLLLYAAHVVQLYVFPNTAAPLRAALAAADYVASTAAPYLAPVLVALALHPELWQSVIGEEPPVRRRMGAGNPPNSSIASGR
jgi:hypothetical protein